MFLFTKFLDAFLSEEVQSLQLSIFFLFHQVAFFNEKNSIDSNNLRKGFLDPSHSRLES